MESLRVTVPEIYAVQNRGGKKNERSQSHIASPTGIANEVTKHKCIKRLEEEIDKISNNDETKGLEYLEERIRKISKEEMEITFRKEIREGCNQIEPMWFTKSIRKISKRREMNKKKGKEKKEMQVKRKNLTNYIKNRKKKFKLWLQEQ